LDDHRLETKEERPEAAGRSGCREIREGLGEQELRMCFAGRTRPCLNSPFLGGYTEMRFEEARVRTRRQG
jgi:hypothetical protein